MIKYTEGQVRDVLERVQIITRDRSDPYLKTIKQGDPTLVVTCPFHANHSERTPACGVFTKDRGSFHTGDFHCFACDARGSLADLVAGCLHLTEEEAEDWILSSCGGERVNDELPPIELERNIPEPIDEDAYLKQFAYYHPYMWERKLTKEVVDKFKIGYDPVSNSIVFPVWDEHGRFQFVTMRSVSTKHFRIPQSAEKPVYLLNYVIKESNADCVYVCESQINTLTCYCYGRVAVGLFGTGSKHQIGILNKSGINHFVLALDPDEAGEKGTKRLIQYLRDDKMVDVMIVPKGKDINDLTREEFDSCEIVSSFEWLERIGATKGANGIQNM